MLTLFRRKLHHISNYHNRDGLKKGQFQSVRNFEESLILLSESLKSREEKGMLCLGWLERALIVALEKHKEAESQIPNIQLPVSESTEKWMNAYLDETTEILDMCNVLTARIAVVEYSQLLVRYGIRALEKPVDSLGIEDVERSRKALLGWLKAIASEGDSSSIVAKKEKYCDLLQSIIDHLTMPKENTAMKRFKGLLYALYGAKATIFLVCAVLSMTFSRDDILAHTPCHPGQFLWSMSIINLLQEAKEEACEQISRGSVTCLSELDNAYVHVRKVLIILDEILKHKFPLTAELAERLVLSVQDLRRSIRIFDDGVDQVAKRINELFHMIIHSRSNLLDHIAGL